jgi:hypothetical protein
MNWQTKIKLQIIYYKIMIKLNKIRGRDKLNSNKTPKEFCKDKRGLEE